MRTTLQISFFLLLFLTVACTAPHPKNKIAQPLDVHYAFMNIEWDSYSSAAKIWQQEHKLRMEVLGGRKSNIMLVDYQNDKALVLIPSQGKYQRFPVERLNQSLPHFFDPQVMLEKKDLGDETISGHPATKYRVLATGRNGKKYRGTLWLSQEWENFPLKWISADKKVIVSWSDLELQSLSTDWFNLPTHYQPLNTAIIQPPQ
ncbi:DUF4412 domain-containing protein [Malonomonas rubra]|nr:DUF4412 domain-containing protein [Malonomonas rubra]